MNYRLSPQTKHLNQIRPNHITKMPRPVLNLDGVAKSIHRIISICSTQPVVVNTANAGRVDDVDENVAADAIARAFRRDEGEAEGRLNPQPAIGQENVYAVGVDLAEVAITIGKREVYLDTVQRTVGKLVDLGFIQGLKGEHRLIRELRRVYAGSSEENHREEIKQAVAHG